MRPYACSRCETTALVADSERGSAMHPCPGLGGMAVPLAPADQRSKAELVAREDYVGADRVQTDAEGRVWSSVVVTTDECEHVGVYAPTATVRAS